MDVYVVAAWILLIAFVAAMLAIGRFAMRGTTSVMSFAIARGRPRPWMTGICFGATFASASMFIGIPGLAYSYGMSILWWTLFSFVAVWIGILLFGKRFWEIGQQHGGALTLPDWLRIRYGSMALGLIVAVLTLFNIFYVIAQTVGMATIFEETMGLTYEWGVFVGVAIIVAYVVLGGAAADIYTDALQGVMMGVVGLVVFASGIWTIGGGLGWMSTLNDRLAAESSNLVAAFNPESPVLSDPFALFTFITMACIAFVLLPHLLNKVLTLKSRRELREFNLAAGITLFFVCNTMVWAGLYVRTLTPGLDNPDSAVPVYLSIAFHPAVSALIAVAILAAALSTTDGLFVSISSVVANDLYKNGLATRLLKQDQPTRERRGLAVARVMVVVVGIGAIAGALTRPEHLTLLLQVGVMAIISGVLSPIALGYVWRRPGPASAIAAVVVGVAVYLTLYLREVPVFNAAFFAACLSALTMIVVALITKPAPRESVALFFDPDMADRAAEDFTLRQSAGTSEASMPTAEEL